MSDLVVRGLQLRSFDAEKRTVEFVASTDAIDSYDEIVDQSWKLDRYQLNPVVLYAHNSRELPIGQAERCLVETEAGKKQLACKIKFASREANPLAEQVYQSVREGTLRAVSVGFVPGDVRREKRDGREVYVLADNELHEISVVPIPANPEALARMRARARSEGEKNMSVEQQLAKREADLQLAEAKLADAHKGHEETRAKLVDLEKKHLELVNAHDGYKARAEKAEARLVESEVEALVGKKITPAQRADYTALAKRDRSLFEQMVKNLPDLNLLGGRVMGDEESPAESRSRSVDRAPHGNGEDLANAIFGNG